MEKYKVRAGQTGKTVHTSQRDKADVADIKGICEELYKAGKPDSALVVRALSAERKDEIEALFKFAVKVRKEETGSTVFLRGIIEISNCCENECFYCGLRKSNKKAKRYRLTAEEILGSAEEIAAAGIKTVLLQSGEISGPGAEETAGIISRIKRETDAAVTLSLGDSSFDNYKMWKDAGADRYLLKVETTNEKLFERIRPGTKFSGRLKRLEWLFKLGYQVGSGNIVGLPGQSNEDIASDLIFFKAIDLDMVSISPLIPHPNTPFSKAKSPGEEKALKALALARILTKNTLIPATTALETLSGGARLKALRAGANVVMISFTPMKHKPEYEIYPERFGSVDDPLKSLNRIKEIIAAAGMKAGEGKGDSFKKR
jgi:biotin synthase